METDLIRAFLEHVVLERDFPDGVDSYVAHELRQPEAPDRQHRDMRLQQYFKHMSQDDDFVQSFEAFKISHTPESKELPESPPSEEEVDAPLTEEQKAMQEIETELELLTETELSTKEQLAAVRAEMATLREDLSAQIRSLSGAHHTGHYQQTIVSGDYDLPVTRLAALGQKLEHYRNLAKNKITDSNSAIANPHAIASLNFFVDTHELFASRDTPH